MNNIVWMCQNCEQTYPEIIDELIDSEYPPEQKFCACGGEIRLGQIVPFHFIRTIEELPQVPASMVNISVDNDTDARRYARETGRTVYWIATKNIGVWFTPLRRQSDGVPA